MLQLNEIQVTRNIQDVPECYRTLQSFHPLFMSREKQKITNVGTNDSIEILTRFLYWWHSKHSPWAPKHDPKCKQLQYYSGTSCIIVLLCCLEPYSRNLSITEHIFLAYFLCFEKLKVGLWDHLAVCLCIPPVNFWMPVQIFMKLSMYIMATESILTAYFINPSHQSVCIFTSLFLLSSGSVSTSPWQRIHATVKSRVWGSVCVFPNRC
jgi:hypothetical protein